MITTTRGKRVSGMPTYAQIDDELRALVEDAKTRRAERRAEMVRVADIEVAQGLARGSGSIRIAMRALGFRVTLLPDNRTTVAFVTLDDAKKIIEYLNR